MATVRKTLLAVLAAITLTPLLGSHVAEATTNLGGSGAIGSTGYRAWTIRVPAGASADLHITFTFAGEEQNQTASIFSFETNYEGGSLGSTGVAIVGNGIDHEGEPQAVGVLGEKTQFVLPSDHQTQAIPLGVEAYISVPSQTGSALLQFGAFSNAPGLTSFDLASASSLVGLTPSTGGSDAVHILTVAQMESLAGANTIAGSEGLATTWGIDSLGPAFLMAVPSYSELPLQPHLGSANAPNELSVTTPDGGSRCTCTDSSVLNAQVARGLGMAPPAPSRTTFADAVSVSSGIPGSWNLSAPTVLDPLANQYRLWFVDLGR